LGTYNNAVIDPPSRVGMLTVYFDQV
jgi:hypothetical protein